ncbi:hypothetical protein Goshw_015524 [Gossypium schwendimanii]|uniref:Uncharacterized protein n=1 Tax=Gossypium schwendimanii TaxID=34291 RepID=A0A7J9MTN5_GOSSC|nr:hypothetical protein [Gossypium schwendimanii]
MMWPTSFHLNVTKKLLQDVYVRWNFTYLMPESSLYYKDVLDYWGQRDKYDNIFVLSNKEWRNVAICIFLKVFYNVTCVFPILIIQLLIFILEGFERFTSFCLIQLKILDIS